MKSGIISIGAYLGMSSMHKLLCYKKIMYSIGKYSHAYTLFCTDRQHRKGPVRGGRVQGFWIQISNRLRILNSNFKQFSEIHVSNKLGFWIQI